MEKGAFHRIDADVCNLNNPDDPILGWEDPKPVYLESFIPKDKICGTELVFDGDHWIVELVGSGSYIKLFFQRKDDALKTYKAVLNWL